MENPQTVIFPEAGKDDIKKYVWGPWATIGFGIVITIVFFVIQIFLGFVFSFISVVSNPDGIPYSLDVTEFMSSYGGLLIAIASIVTAIFCVGLILIFVKAKTGASIKEYLGLRKISIGTILILLVITLAFLMIFNIINVIFQVSGEDNTIVSIYETSMFPALLWIAIVIFGPVFEEAFMRGFLFEGFRLSRIGAVGAITITSLIWALFHIQYNLFGIFQIFVFGLILGIVRLKTKSLWSSVIMHSFFNFLVLLSIYINVTPMG